MAIAPSQVYILFPESAPRLFADVSRPLSDRSSASRLTSAALLVAALALGLLGVWLIDDLADLRGSPAWFPVWLHSITEVFSITVAVLVFAVAWHSNHSQSRSNPLLGCAFLAIALLDLAHLLSYKGMPDFVTPASPEKAIGFWLVARLFTAAALLLVAIRWSNRQAGRSRLGLLVASLAAVALTLYLKLYQPQIWPRTFIEGQGLTAFKIAVEWLLIALLGIAAARFWYLRNADLPYDARGMLAATLISILSELCFTFYGNVNSFYSLLGHIYKIISYCFIYQVVFVASIRAPYERLSQEMNERQAAERQVEFLAFHDSLTGLPNQSLLKDRTRQALSRTQRKGGLIAMLFLDVDDFKLINDALGHGQGDALLRAMARRLESLIPESATPSRSGGDEFVILLADLEDTDAVANRVQQILAGLEEPFVIAGERLQISVSLGAAVAPGDAEDFAGLLRNAEMAMYRAKASGRRTWRYYDVELDSEMQQRLQMINDLRQAVGNQELVLYYQPQIDLRSNAIIGVEALIRWQHPSRGLVPPDQFIPLAEDSGLIVSIGAWTLDEACRQMARWRTDGAGIACVAVNISAVQLYQGDLESAVTGALKRHALPASCLELELTESSLIRNTTQVLEKLDRLKRLGVRLSIDDFGTGYSSLAYLQRLAVDMLKIDRTFVQNLHAADGAAIVSAIIQMATALGLQTLAEGVEDQLTGEALQALGCDFAQGYHYARPCPAADLALGNAGRNFA